MSNYAPPQTRICLPLNCPPPSPQTKKNSLLPIAPPPKKKRCLVPPLYAQSYVGIYLRVKDPNKFLTLSLIYLQSTMNQNNAKSFYAQKYADWET